MAWSAIMGCQAEVIYFRIVLNNGLRFEQLLSLIASPCDWDLGFSSRTS